MNSHLLSLPFQCTCCQKRVGSMHLLRGHWKVEDLLRDTHKRETPWTQKDRLRRTGSTHFNGSKVMSSPCRCPSTWIFLPYRSHFNFFIPLRNFLRRLALPPSHSASIHPCLRNACHLAACSVIGGRWSYLEQYFAERTRHFLDEALMLADPEHLTQFLWASVILASYFTRVGRVEESFAVISPASHLGAACGLGSTHNPDVEDDYQPDEFLLPAPTTEDEAFERLLLSKSIFITDWSLNMLTGCPATFVCDDRWIPCLDKDEIIYTWFKPRLTGEKELVKMWQSDIHRTTSLTFLFVLVTTAANSIAKKQSIGDQKSLKSFIRFHDAIIPSFSEAVDNSNSTALLLHATLYGSSAIFHSLFAGKDARARSEMLRCVQMLVDLCSQLQRHQNTRMMQPSLVPMVSSCSSLLDWRILILWQVHMMNALRILAHELRRPDVQENPTISSEYCRSIEVLLDFLEGMIGFYPAWKNSLDLIKETLTSAMESLKI
ncbi:hypothetical protein DL93DRAFT_1562781 [Clavulina sp. PMI_390]|nr:hypothetical protein DL93DRAFT_1562781 [Clavulina sp. PMI_390]